MKNTCCLLLLTCCTLSVRPAGAHITGTDPKPKATLTTLDQVEAALNVALVLLRLG